MQYKIYFAGELFDQKHITGNFFLAKAINKLENGSYKCILPQDWEGAKFDNEIDIRNKDFSAVMNADLALFNFDGIDLDSGTVAEFMFAKMLDIPAVLLRTEIRNGGYLFNADWNLMVSGFPRCKVVKHSALELYNDLALDIEQTHNTIAKSIISAFEKALKQEPILNSYDDIFYAYKHIIKMCGPSFNKLFSDEYLHNLIATKIDKKIYIDNIANKKIKLKNEPRYETNHQS